MDSRTKLPLTVEALRSGGLAGRSPVNLRRTPMWGDKTSNLRITPPDVKPVLAVRAFSL